MKTSEIKWAPILATAGVLAVVCLVQALPRVFPKFDLLQQFEWKFYDFRMQLASRMSHESNTNLAAVLISDDTIDVIGDGSLGTVQYGLYWPRLVYGRMLRELAAQGAKWVGIDIMFPDMRLDHPRLRLPDGTRISSDAFFALQLRSASNVVLGAEKYLPPADLFLTNAWGLGDVFAEEDSDGILRRAQPFRDYTLWHPAIRRAARLNKWDLANAQVTTAGLALPTPAGTNVFLPLILDANGEFDLSQLRENLKQPPIETDFEDEFFAQLPPRGKVNSVQRVWSLGLVLAALELKLDLNKARLDPNKNRIVLPGPAGLERVIPLDRDGRFYIDWSIALTDQNLTKDSLEHLLSRDLLREAGIPNEPDWTFTNKLVFVGSRATGADLNDMIATPWGKRTVGVSTHWNVANTLITGRFIRPKSDAVELVLILLLGTTTAWPAYRLSMTAASIWAGVIAALYLAAAGILFVHFRYWLPVVLPVFGGLLLSYVGMVTYRVFFEQKEQRRVRSVFSKLVAPDVVKELLETERLSLGGSRRMLTVFFADVRGFTEMTDVSQANAENYVRERQLTGRDADDYFDEQAREVLATVNLYLSTIADIIKQQAGTLDKYIGDCVMAFWGAPTPNEQHALYCVRAAIDAQRAIADLNLKRQADNQRREQENKARAANGQPPLSMLPLLSLGTGINTGMVTVGLMGSDAHILNYTVFGREVNLASRLEGVSGRGRIIISESTYDMLQRDDPALAASCAELAPVTVKGIRKPVRIFEAPWKTSEPPAVPAPSKT